MERARKLILALALFVALAVPGTSYAEFYDGYELKKLADVDDRSEAGNAQPGDHYDIGVLIGFVVGVYDTIDQMRIVCLPHKAKVGQLIGVVKKYVRDNPDKWDRPATALVVNALSTAFPCKKR